MLKYTALLVPITMGSLMFACGSDDGDNAGSGGSANSGGPGPVIVTGGTNGTPNQNGGTTPLTPEQIEAIEDGACAGWSTEGEPLPAAIQLVVDVSGSMEDPAPGGGGSKWTVTRNALLEAIDALPASTSLGILFYPNRSTPANNNPTDVDACVDTDEMVPINVLGPANSMHRNAIRQAMQRADTGNYTPTHDAYRYALESGLKPFNSTAPKFMLLITDGAPTMSLGCVRPNGGVQDMPTDPIIADITAARSEGIKSFIIGSPGSEESSESNTDMRPWLSRAAMEGGTAIPGCSENGPNFCHMDMTQEENFADALRRGLGSVASQIASCTYAIPEPPNGEVIDRGKVNLIVQSDDGAVLVNPDGQGECTEGWVYDDDGNVQLCPATCSAVQADPSAQVKLLFGCMGGMIPVF